MSRDERLQTSVTEEEKRQFRMEAAKRDMTMSEYLRGLVYDAIDESGEADEGNSTTPAMAD